jgi:hypothetical protein
VLQSPLEVFEDTLNRCLRDALEGILGSKVRDELYNLLARSGIAAQEVPRLFDDVVHAMGEIFGILQAKIIVHKALVNLYREYSQPINFSYDKTLRDKLLSLGQRVVSNNLWPRGFEDETSLPETEPAGGEEGSESLDNIRDGGEGLYRYKQGVSPKSPYNW